jgi:hypothetical protein
MFLDGVPQPLETCTETKAASKEITSVFSVKKNKESRNY